MIGKINIIRFESNQTKSNERQRKVDEKMMKDIGSSKPQIENICSMCN